MKRLLVIFLSCLPLLGWALKEGEVKVLKREIYVRNLYLGIRKEKGYL